MTSSDGGVIIINSVPAVHDVHLFVLPVPSDKQGNRVCLTPELLSNCMYGCTHWKESVMELCVPTA